MPIVRHQNVLVQITSYKPHISWPFLSLALSLSCSLTHLLSLLLTPTFMLVKGVKILNMNLGMTTIRRQPCQTTSGSNHKHQKLVSWFRIGVLTDSQLNVLPFEPPYFQMWPCWKSLMKKWTKRKKIPFEERLWLGSLPPFSPFLLQSFWAMESDSIRMLNCLSSLCCEIHLSWLGWLS